jgi:hypothetical protein
MKTHGERLGSEARLPGHRARKMAEKVFSLLFQEYVLLETPRNHPADFEKKVQGLMREGNYWPVILGTHKAHPAGFPLIEEADYLAEICNPFLSEDNQIAGSLLLIANTMEGGQSDAVVEGLKQAKPIFKKYHTETALVLREKDANDLEADEKREYQKQLFRKLGGVVKAGQIPLVLPEGTVESGRQKPDGAPGEINGMVHLQSDSVAFLAQMIRRQKKDPLFFFVGTTGENRIYNPIIEKITKEARDTALKRALPFGKHFVPPIMSSVVDYPTSYSQLVDAYGEGEKLSSEVLERVCGERLAQLVPLNERGVFAEPELLDLAPEIQRRDTAQLFQ